MVGPAPPTHPAGYAFPPAAWPGQLISTEHQVPSPAGSARPPGVLRWLRLNDLRHTAASLMIQARRGPYRNHPRQIPQAAARAALVLRPPRGVRNWTPTFQPRGSGQVVDASRPRLQNPGMPGRRRRLGPPQPRAARPVAQAIAASGVLSMPVEQLLGKDGQPLALAQRAIATVISDLARLGWGN
jgi:hypothetical protein